MWSWQIANRTTENICSSAACATANTFHNFSRPSLMPSASAFKILSPAKWHLRLPLPSHGPLPLGTCMQCFCQPPRVRSATGQQRRQRRCGKQFRCLDVVSRAHAVLRFRYSLLLPCWALHAICWSTGCCFGGGAAKRLRGTAYGRTCAASAAGCALAAWRASCRVLYCFEAEVLFMKLRPPISLDVEPMNSMRKHFDIFWCLTSSTLLICCVLSTP